MIEKIAVDKIHPKLVKHVREVAKGKVKAEHPIYDVSEHVGTGKATCRGCGEFIKEGEPALLFWQAPYDQDHKLHFFRNRSVIHTTGCLEGDLIRCPHCKDEVADGTLGQHISDSHSDRFQWRVIRRASITKVCLLHRLSHCGQCEEDRELEEPKFREEVKKLLKIETAALSDDEIANYFDEPEGFVEDIGVKQAAGAGRSTQDIAQEVTDSIIASLEKGVAPWTRPWTSDSGVLPTSVHGRPYRGINLLLLGLQQQTKGYKSPYWVTYEQAKKLGGNVRRGEKSTLVTFRKKIQVPDKNTIPEPGQDPKLKTIPLLRQYRVFNLDQTDNVKLTPKLQKATEPRPPVETLPQLEEVIRNYKGAPPISNRAMHASLDAPYYSPSRDEIVLPLTDQFESPEAYARTMFHELTHSTGHQTRLNRFEDTGEPRHFGSELYAKEELVAELGSAMLRAHANIPGQDERSASYVQSWLKALRNDKNLVISAAGKAQNAVDHILGVDPSTFKNDEDDEASSLEKESSVWRHTEDDGFEMWETTEDPNKFAIIENDDKYDLYVLNGSFDSPEEAKNAAGTQKTAQDGGGGSSGGGGGDGGGGGSAGSSGGGDGGSASGDGGTSSGEGGESSGDAGLSSGTTDSDADSSVDDGDSDDSDDGDEDPRPPSGGHDNCPRCGEHLNPIYLVGGRIYTCMNCGFTNRKKKRIKDASWFDRIPHAQIDQQNPNEIIELSIDPRIPFTEEELTIPTKDRINSAELFSMSAARYRHCVVCGKVLGRSTRGHYTGLCETHREHTGLVVHEYGSQDSREPHNE